MVRLVNCPHCGAEAPFEPSNRWRPFCSERCRLVDLGAWAAGDYRIPDNQAPTLDEPGEADGRSSV